MEREPTLTRAPGVLWRNTMRGVLISPADGVDPLLCSTPGDVVWKLLAEPVTRSDLVAELADIFDADAETIAADLETVLATLLEAGALLEE